MIIAFDVDDTLIVPSVATGFDRDTPNYDVIMLYRWFQSQGHTMVIWSGGGKGGVSRTRLRHLHRLLDTTHR